MCSLGLINTCRFLNFPLKCVFFPQNSKTVVSFWQQISQPDGNRFKKRRYGNSNKLKLIICAAGDAEEKETFDSVLKFEIFESGSDLSVAHSEVTVAA